MSIKIKDFVASYLATAAWVTADSDENDEFTEEAQVRAKNDCIEFISMVTVEFGMDKAVEILTIEGQDVSYLAPHDFFLTRNGHGSGFWDKEDVYGEDEAKRLTLICAEMGEVDCYHIDDKDSLLTF
jgi:hypothetical protein